MTEGEKSPVALREEEILRWWQERGIFRKTLAKASPRGEFVFYEGPPTANGRPGIHHVESRSFKDAIPRFRTMQGYHVRRKAGWDTHGLPVELEVEKELGIKNKKEIESYGIAKFNEKCKESVLRYIDEWKNFTDRIAYWVDHDSTYFTFKNEYIESIWHILKVAHERGLLYKDYKVVPWCPRCGTGLSSHEVAQGYQDDTPDPSVYVLFRAAEADEYFLAWTTTPWTLPGNLALAVGADVEYVLASISGKKVWLAASRLEHVAPGSEVMARVKGSELVGRSYKPLFPYLAQALPHSQEEALAKSYKIYAADFVSTDDGTGIVHTAVMYGADDFELGTQLGLPKYHLVGEDGAFLPAAGPLAGKFAKDADADVIAALEDRGLLFKKEVIKHTYPFCWRCKTPLLYYARDSWYIRMSAIKDELLRENERIHWEPGHIQGGRFGEWLRDLKDWAISRSRYWGTPLPIWECGGCGRFEVIGSIAELRQKTKGSALDLHRPYIDEFSYACGECEGQMRRVPEVLDVWFDSGAMPFAQDHYPFENRERVEGAGYPADYICEAIDQTRGWFYTLHAVGGIMGRGRAFKNVICLGHVLDAKGKKMSKSLGNVVVPGAMIDKYGIDALRFFMYTVNAPGDSKNFDERLVDEIVKKNLGRLSNVLAFYKLYADGTPSSGASEHVLDRWILARLGELVRASTEGYESYRLDAAVRPFALFIDDLSAWYVRRSRDRFRAGGDDTQAAVATLRHVLRTLSLVMAPAMPFFAEHLFREVREDGDAESVHLSTWPEARQKSASLFDSIFAPFLRESDEQILSRMARVRELVSQALDAREKAGIKVRQPLSALRVPKASYRALRAGYMRIIAEEVNVKKIECTDEAAVCLDTELTDELREEGIVRDTMRLVQEARKAARLRPGEKGAVSISVKEEHRLVVERNLQSIGEQTHTDVTIA